MLSLAGQDWPVALDSSSSDLVRDFFGPALSCSAAYDRAVGYFSSGWMRVAAEGMVRFAAAGGRARWVTSPILDERDWEALLAGDAARRDSMLRRTLEENVADLARTLEKDTLSALAWMVADGVITFKLALPREKLAGGEFHDKFGVFSDASGNRVSFNGSYNDSVQGNRNYESITVFCSWEPAYAPLVEMAGRRFDRLWSNLDPNVRVFDLPQAAREQILRLRTGQRPYPVPDWVKAQRGGEVALAPLRPSVPGDLIVRNYQLEAIDAWFEEGGRGLLEMATGTGKTITSLAASVRLYEREGRLAVIIACPYQHLVDQWYEEARRFGYAPLRAYKSRSSWLDKLNERVIAYNRRDTDHLCVIVTHATFATDHFRRTLERIEGPTLLLADEVHHLGAATSRGYLPENVEYRLALSATPDRWYDEAGTVALRGYFGPTVFEFPLADAIGGSLTPYYYHPMLVELAPHEMEEYRTLSAKIGRLVAQAGEEDEHLTRLLMKRAQLLNGAENKLRVVNELIGRQYDMTHALFYCAPGQINDVVKLLGWEKGLRVRRFTAEEDVPTRRRLLEEFAEGELQGLVAMRCLDEGVDVPSTRTAYILASSSNPREFIQRRGRVLRRAPGKDHATIYDLMTVPPPAHQLDEQALKAERSILRRELRRFTEFADNALNTQAAYEVVWDLADRYGVLDFR